MRVLHVASELAPFAQSGGLADVVAGLPAAQAELGLDASVIVPLYRGVAERVAAGGHALGERVAMPLVVGGYALDAGVRLARIGRVTCAFLDCPALYDRDGGLYGPGGAAEFGDNHVRFAALGKAALEVAAILGAPDVIHAHDWHGGAAAVYAHLAESPASVVTTVHNLAFRGIFPKAAMTELGLPWSLFTQHLVEFYDQLSLLKAGLALADAVTTVSPTYATEIVTPARGEALDGFLRHDVGAIVGIVNGIDTESWDPAMDPALPAAYSAGELAGKAVCREALVAEAGLPPLAEHELVLGVVARMSDQKGLDLVAEIAPELGSLGARLVVLGSGDPGLEAWFRELARTCADRISVAIGFDGGYARRIYAGSDLFAMPSRFEPCGLGQLYAMRYGAIPIVHAVGGLRDTVIDLADDPDRGTGLCFHRATASELFAAIERGVRLHRDRAAFTARQRIAMARDSSWTRSAREYIALYETLRA